MNFTIKWARLPYLVMPLLFLIPAFTQVRQETCTNQSPRNVTVKLDSTNRAPYNYVSTVPLASPVTGTWPESVRYQRQDLKRCDQHYHAPVENVQGCDGEKLPPSRPDVPPPPGSWIEVHTVFALAVDSTGKCADHLDHDLACCITPPFVVIAYSAKIGADSMPVPAVIKPPIADLAAEWSGSNTGSDDDTKCKPLPAQWNFALGCNFTVPRNYISEILPKKHSARSLQTGNLISRDLTLAGPIREISSLSCKYVENTTGLVITNNAEARARCPVVCRNTLSVTDFADHWENRGGKSSCLCCTPYRPQPE